MVASEAVQHDEIGPRGEQSQQEDFELPVEYSGTSGYDFAGRGKVSARVGEGREDGGVREKLRREEMPMDSRWEGTEEMRDDDGEGGEEMMREEGREGDTGGEEVMAEFQRPKGLWSGLSWGGMLWRSA